MDDADEVVDDASVAVGVSKDYGVVTVNVLVGVLSDNC
jgi:hypothetical protein